jgi:copper chaperone CopZ
MNREELMSKIKEKIQVEGRSSTYNPLIQKPVQLNPIGPGNYANGVGGYAYVGPPPDFGGSYGAYQDTSGFTQIGIKASKMFSMVDGSPMQLTAELTEEERQALLAQLEEASELYKCPHCRSELCISVASALESEKVHCPHCASAMDGAIEKVKSVYSKLQEKQMSTNVKAAEEKAKEPLKVGSDAKDIAKEAMKAETPAQTHTHEKAEKAQMMEPEVKVQEIKPMDELAKAPVKAEADEAAKKEEAEKAEKAKAEAEKEEKAKAEKKEKLQAAFAKYKARKAVKAKAEAKAKMEAKAEAFDAKTLMALKRELRVMATVDADKFAEVKKHPKLAKICAEVEKTLHSKSVRAQVRAELKALASEDMEAAEEAKKELEFVAPEILVEEPVSFEIAEEGEEHEEKKAEGAEEMCDAPAEAAEEIPAEEEALSMKTEFLASMEALKGEKVEMSLYGEDSENPFWNVMIDGEPVARIHLADQNDAASIRASFTTEAYADNLGKLIGEMGAKKILPMVQAKFFAHQIDESAITARIREKAKLEAKAEMEEKIGTLRSDFLRAVGTVMAAADKNFYQEEGRHALKGGLFNALVQAGLTEQHAVWAIEAGFESAPEYFNFVMDKAVEMMDMPKEARESLEKTISASGKIDVQGSEPEQEESLVDRLVKSSVSAIAMGGSVSGENREVIRSQMGLKSTRR